MFLAYLALLKEQARKAYQFDVLVWAALAPHQKRRSKPPDIPVILRLKWPTHPSKSTAHCLKIRVYRGDPPTSPQLENLKNGEGSGRRRFRSRESFRGLAAIGALLKLEEIGKEAFDAAVNIGKMADKTGISTETLSVFHHVAEKSATSTEVVDKALVKAAKSITEFELGTGKAANGFALLGIRQKDFANLNSDQKIALVTERLGHMEKGFAKTTAAQLIFSKSGADFIPIANAVAAEGYDKHHAESSGN